MQRKLYSLSTALCLRSWLCQSLATGKCPREGALPGTLSCKKALPGLASVFPPNCTVCKTISAVVQTTPGSVADVLWAAAVLDAGAPASISKLRELAAILNASQLDAETLQRVFQAHMALDKRPAGSAEQGGPLLPPELLQQAKQAWQDRLASTAARKVIIRIYASIKVI